MVQKNEKPNLLVWQKAMFILTFANLVQAIGHTSDRVANKLYFNKLVDEHHLNISQNDLLIRMTGLSISAYLLFYCLLPP